MYLCCMNTTLETNNQQPSVLRNKDEGSETIPKGSRKEISEAVSTLLEKSKGKDIVHKSKAFIKYINKANQMFNNKFDYSEFIYKNAKTKSTIICPIHGKFIQNMDKHTAKNSHGCASCWKDNKPFPYWLGGKDITSFEAFLLKANKIYQEKYSYVQDTYKGLTTKMTIVCKKHGSFKILPCQFLKSKIGCPKCARNSAKNKMTDSYKDLINQVKLIHNNKYTYYDDNDTYINKKSKIKINCPKHGDFFKKAQKHISGQGCFKCRIEDLVKNNILIGGYSEELFNNKPELKNKSAKLYLLKINDFYKIGITTTKVENRIRGLKAKAKKSNSNLSIKLLHIQNDTLYNCFKKEQLILQENNSERLYKSWSTELLRIIDIDKYF